MAHPPPYSSSVNPVPPFRFLDLPTELRFIIYSHIAQDVMEPNLPLDVATIRYRRINTSILTACKLIFKEAQETLMTAQQGLPPTLIMGLNLPRTRSRERNFPKQLLTSLCHALFTGHAAYVDQQPETSIPMGEYLLFCETTLLQVCEATREDLDTFVTSTEPILRAFYKSTIQQIHRVGELTLHLRLFLPGGRAPRMDDITDLFWLERYLTSPKSMRVSVRIVLLVDGEHVRFFERVNEPILARVWRTSQATIVVRSVDGEGG